MGGWSAGLLSVPENSPLGEVLLLPDGEAFSDVGQGLRLCSGPWGAESPVSLNTVVSIGSGADGAVAKGTSALRGV